MLTYLIEADFNDAERGYIGNPYTVEMYRYIQITKESGMNRARSAANRRKALEEYLRQSGMTLVEFESLEQEAKRAFIYDNGEIVVPRHVVDAFLVATSDELRSASRPCDPAQVRSRLRCTAWRTGKHEQDGVWSRFATVTAGTGAKLSNQRALRENPYITGFVARGSISFDPEYVNPDTLKKAIAWGGQFVGIGASRKMGWGRFGLKSFVEAPSLKAAAE